MCYMYRYLFTLLLSVNFLPVFAQQQMHAGVLVIGGGTGGTAAGLQSARMGVRTIIAESSVWLGGMFSSAGVPAFDGNHHMPSGIWAEFRERVYKVYGGPGRVATGWVSNTLFEPHVGDSILKAMVSATPELKVLYGLEFKSVIKSRLQIKGAVFYNRFTKSTVTIYASQVIDATELGDAMGNAGIPFDVGMEANSITGENVNIPASNNIIQDITYAAILQDYGPAADCTLVKQPGYNPMEFDGCCNEFCSDPSKLTSNVTAKKMLEYGKLPNGKYMINWPGKGNDIYLNVISMNPEQREKELQKAKDKTLRFIYFLQTQFGFKNLGLANNEFPTTDRLPIIPYHREGRRLKGMARFTLLNIADPFNEKSPLYRTGISVGDYPIDHHHRENPDAPQHLGFYPIPSFNVPLGALIPKQYTGMIIAEKAISVSNVVNGTTRLQPCVMLTGQAAGALAALAVQQQKNASRVAVREVQGALLKSKAYIMPYYDVPPTHPFFTDIQKIGATGILKGTGQPNAWANRTWFYPDSTIGAATLAKDINEYTGLVFLSKNQIVTLGDIIRYISIYKQKNKKPGVSMENVVKKWAALELKNFEMNRSAKRFEIAVLLNKWLNPFDALPINHQGKLITSKTQ
ncbi:MAG: FAD-dependent oxidoreductase [Ferruginibacter sp.]|nr:FAD-dependent oxidoreductase [Ferruginibacter sp.]